MKNERDLPHSEGPAGGWGSLKGIARIYGESWATPAAADNRTANVAPTTYDRNSVQ